MIALLDLDLLAVPHVLDKQRGQEALVLVRAGREVLGQRRLAAELDAEQALELVELGFASMVLARRLVPDAPPGGLAPQDVTVVVCTRDRPDHLEACLEHLQLLSPAPARVLVVDNGSTGSETKEVCERRGVKHLLAPVAGLDRARNAGWQAVTTEVVLYVDDDARADPGLVAAVAEAFSTEQVGAVTGLVLPASQATEAQRRFEEQGGMGKGFEPTVFHRSTWGFGVQPWRLGVGTNMAFRRSALETVDGFDERLDVGTRTRGGGDLDALFRVLLSGSAVAYTPHAVVRHHHRETWAGLVEQMTSNGVAMSALLEKYRSEHPDLARAADREERAWHLRRHVVELGKHLARGRWWQARLLLAEARGSRLGRAALAAGSTG